MTPPDPQVTITMDGTTVSSLAYSGYSLFAYAAVQCSDKLGVPLVWMATQEYSETTPVQVGSQFEVYTVPGVGGSEPVVPGFTAPISLGETLDWDGAVGTVSSAGTAGAITILNQSSDAGGCGILVEADDTFAPVCLVPLHGNQAQVMVPLPYVLLLFSTASAAPGTVAATAPEPGVLLDLSQEAQPAVSYDIDTGWSWGTAAWACAVPYGTPLAPLLVPQSGDWPCPIA
jgi:hypothetical protein